MYKYIYIMTSVSGALVDRHVVFREIVIEEKL